MSSFIATISKENKSSVSKKLNQPVFFKEYKDANICSAASIFVSLSFGKRTINVTKSNAYSSRFRYLNHWNNMYMKIATITKQIIAMNTDTKNEKICVNNKSKF